MKQRIEPTHFIEQYNTKPETLEFMAPEQCYTIEMPIDRLTAILGKTKQMTYRHTVAIWKIKYKNDKNIIHEPAS